MRAPDILANMAQGWNRNPIGAAIGTERTGFAAALWTCKIDETSEVSSEIDVKRHIVCVMLSEFEGQTTYDGRIASKGKHRPGMITIVPAGVRPRAILSGRYSILHCYLPHSVLSRVACEAELTATPSAIELFDPACAFDPMLKQIGEGIRQEFERKDRSSQLRVDLLSQQLAIHLLLRHSNLAGPSAARCDAAKGGLAPHHIHRVTQYMEDHLARDVSLAELAGITGLSTFHLCRAFKQSTGLPPHRWRLARRIERAREMLENTDLPVTEVAAAVGYDDPSQLACAFRKALGVSPSQYRRERRF